MYSRVIVEPPVEPLTLTEVKLNRRVEHDLDDDLLTLLIVAARRYVEQWCQISMVTQTREAGYDSFSNTFWLPYGPIQEVISLEYTATDGVATPITDYQADLYGAIPQLVPAFNMNWPVTVGASVNVATVRYVAGYTPVAGSPTDYTSSVPQDLKTAMHLLIGNWYENREASITGTINTALELGVKAILEPYRLRKSLA